MHMCDLIQHACVDIFTKSLAEITSRRRNGCVQEHSRQFVGIQDTKGFSPTVRALVSMLW